MKLDKVKNRGDLARDPRTGSIVNENSLDYEKYVQGRKVKKVKNESLDTMKNDLDNLKSEMNEIKSLLKELVNGN